MYKHLSRSAQRELEKKYAKTKKGSKLIPTLNRLVSEGFFCLFSFIAILFAVIIYDLAWWYWILVVSTFAFGMLFLIGQHIIRMREYNNFLKHMNKNEKNQLTKSE